MEKNTVLLSLRDYNGLREFREEIEKGNTFCDWGFRYISTDEAVKEITECNQALKKQLDESLIKKMSIWQFIKWRKTI